MNKRKCVVCRKEIIVKEEHIGSTSYRSGSSNQHYTTSKEGILFNIEKNRAWFCNKCWEIITKNVMDRS